MTYEVLRRFRIKTSQGMRELQAGQFITLSIEKAVKLLNEGRITPTDRMAYKVFSEILETHLWVVYGPEDVKGLRVQGVTEVSYTSKEIVELSKLPPKALKGIHTVKEVFPMSTVEKVINDSVKGEHHARRLE